MTIKVAIMASGNGSNAQALIDHSRKLSKVIIECVITDNKDAFVIERAKKEDIPCYVIEKNNSSKQEHEKKLLKTLQNHNVQWVFLAGYMKLLGTTFLEEYNNRVINIHPSLLPKYPGLDSFKRAFDANDKVAGVTIHYVDEGMDTGEIIVQKEFKRTSNMSFDVFKQTGHIVEHELYCRVLTQLNDTDTISKEGLI